ncbi:MAG: hypothetical protein ACD_4C00441G0010 [uncultured bacterium (gcode 4)]|uniref:Uncharacterized protein n=1 Tax=uncultured bacterium (gcode 4) TaxID=1234023 RepID=K2FW34_9BACT|nr:MAG: hypothetical protein ACD_4C00441G0010 [uncultured bacterium (gcode 4)]
MNKKDIKRNKVFILFSLVYNFIATAVQSLILFIKFIFRKQPRPIKENKFLDVLNFIFHIWPKNFWKKPTWIKIWRSIGTFIHYIFYKEDSFKEKK